jgi:hypothetical protein
MGNVGNQLLLLAPMPMNCEYVGKDWSKIGANLRRDGSPLGPECLACKVVWYHDTMTKNLTIRIPDDVAANAEAIARVDGTSLNETVKQSLIEAVERRRKNPAFKARLKEIIEEDRELLERLAK